MTNVTQPEEIFLDRQEIQEGAPFAVLSYVFCLWILTFIYKKDNRFALFHARQGILVFTGTFACFLLKFMPFIGAIFVIFLLVFFAASVYGMYLALTGKMCVMYGLGYLLKKIDV